MPLSNGGNTTLLRRERPQLLIVNNVPKYLYLLKYSFLLLFFNIVMLMFVFKAYILILVDIMGLCLKVVESILSPLFPKLILNSLEKE